MDKTPQDPSIAQETKITADLLPPETPLKPPTRADSLPPIPLDPPPVDPPTFDPPSPDPLPQDPPPLDPPVFDPSLDPPSDPVTPLPNPVINPLDPPPLTPLGTDPRANSLPQVEKTPDLQSPPPSQEPKKGSSVLKVLSFLFITVILLAGSTSISLAYTNYKILSIPKPVQNVIDSIILKTPLPKTPRMVLEKTQAQIVNLKTAVIETNLAFSTAAQNFPIKNAQITVKGPFDFKTQNQSKIQFDISGSIATEGLQVSATGQIRRIADKMYFEMTEIPAGSFLPLEGLKNQWFVTDIPKSETQTASPNSGKIKEILENFVAKSSNWSQVSKDQDDLYRVVVKPPKQEIDNLLFDIISQAQPQNQTDLETSIQKDNLSKYTKNLQNVEITLKVRKKDYFPQEASIVLLMQVDAPAGILSQQQVQLAPTSTIPITLTATSKFSNYNEPVIVEIPEGARDVKEAEKSIENNLMNKYKTSPTTPNPFLPTPTSPSPFPFSSPSPQKDQSSFRNLLDQKSPVLGEKKTNWDLIILKMLFP